MPSGVNSSQNKSNERQTRKGITRQPQARHLEGAAVAVVLDDVGRGDDGDEVVRCVMLVVVASEVRKGASGVVDRIVECGSGWCSTTVSVEGGWKRRVAAIVVGSVDLEVLDSF
ncbi:hypothetical protein Tco_0739240 [Tanacetum coccineum]